MISQVLIASIALIFAVCAVVEVLKRSFRFDGVWVPLSSVLVGLTLGIAIQPISGHNLLDMLLYGILAGLAASGLFDLCNKIVRSL